MALTERYGCSPPSSVPDWIIGCFQRRSISFANGLTDSKTLVFWLQSRNITIDLRLPIAAQQVPAKPLDQYDAIELRTLANYEGWYAESLWQDDWLSWSGGTSFQIHNRWPEPASLKRVGDCMLEFSPLESYIEDWRIQSREAGPLIGLRLVAEEDLNTGQVRHRDGALIVNGNWAGLVLGRAADLSGLAGTGAAAGHQLRDVVCTDEPNPALLQDVFNFETSVASGDPVNGFTIVHSTRPERMKHALFPLDGFEFDQQSGEIVHILEGHNTALKRRFTIDTLETSFPFSASTSLSSATAEWLDFESETLGRYLSAWTQE
jgi:hypothetical protein